MKLNIRKMQEGGALGSSAQAYGFLDYTPYIPQTAQTAGSGKTGVPTGEQPGGILSDDMIKALMGKGLTSDVNRFVSEVNSMYSNPLEANPFESSLNSSDIARKQLTLISRINQIQNGKAMFDKAVDAARTSGALDEVAVTSFGKVITFDNEAGGIKQISPTELAENSDRYAPLTNAELANLRMNNSNLAYDTNIFNILENAVGSKEIDEYIRTVINEAGKTSSEYNQFIPGSELGNVKKGLELLQQGVVEENITDETNLAQLEAAKNYLYKSLPDNYKKFLAAKAAASGQDPVEGVFNLIQDYANAKTTVTKKRKLSLPASLNKESDSEGKGTVETEVYDWMSTGQALSPESKVNYTFNPGSTYQFSVKGASYYNNFPDFKGEPLSPITTLNTLFTDTKLSTMLDKAGVSVGTQVAKPTDFGNIGIDTTQGAVYALLPSKVNGNGRRVVDLGVTSRIEETMKKLDKGASNTEIIDALESEGLGDYIDTVIQPSEQSTQALYNSDKIAPFLIFSGYASDNNFIDSNGAADIINDVDETRKIEQGINADREKHNLGEIDFTSGPINSRLFGQNIGNVNMYKTAVFIPYSPSAVSETLLSNGQVFVNKKDRTPSRVFGVKSSNNESIRTNW